MESSAIPPNATIRESSPHGRYVKLDSRLGSGAYKDVWRAYDTNEGIEVAWNVVKLSRVPPSERKRIKTEVTLLRDIEHKNVIKYYNSWVDREKEQIIFITEIMSSGSLKDYLRKNPIIRWNAVKRWCRQILTGIEFLHANKIIHRDIKCDNIFINGTAGDLRIGDLGLSTRIAEERGAITNSGQGEADNHRVMTTTTMTCLGTPEFMAPELYEESYTDKVDVYAFGMAMIEMVTGLLPYHQCTSAAQIYRKVMNDELPPELDIIALSHPKAYEFIRGCLLRQDQRPTATELLANDFLLPNEEEDYQEVRVKLTSLKSKLPAITETADVDDDDDDDDDDLDSEERWQIDQHAQEKIITVAVPMDANSASTIHELVSVSESVSTAVEPETSLSKRDAVGEPPSQPPTTTQPGPSKEASDEAASLAPPPMMLPSSDVCVHLNDGGAMIPVQTISRGGSTGSMIGDADGSNTSATGGRSSRTLLRRKYIAGGATHSGSSTVGRSESISSIAKITTSTTDILSSHEENASLPSLAGNVASSVMVNDVVVHNENPNILVFHLRLSSVGHLEVQVEFDYDLILDNCEVIAEEMIHHPDVDSLHLDKVQVLKVFQPFVDASQAILESQTHPPSDPNHPPIIALAQVVLDEILSKKEIADQMLLRKLQQRRDERIYNRAVSTTSSPRRSMANATSSSAPSSSSQPAQNQSTHMASHMNNLSPPMPYPGGNIVMNGLPNGGGSGPTVAGYGPFYAACHNGTTMTTAEISSSMNLHVDMNMERMPLGSSQPWLDHIYTNIDADITDEELENDEEYKELLSKYQQNVSRIEKEHNQRQSLILSQRKSLEETYKKKRDELICRQEDLVNQLNVMQNKFKERMTEIDDRKRQLEEILARRATAIANTTVTSETQVPVPFNIPVEQLPIADGSQTTVAAAQEANDLIPSPRDPMPVDRSQNLELQG
jgi:WNK lysine deficient protein kinase